MTTPLEAAWEEYELAHDALNTAIAESTQHDDSAVAPALHDLLAARGPVEAAARAAGEAHLHDALVTIEAYSADGGREADSFCYNIAHRALLPKP